MYGVDVTSDFGRQWATARAGGFTPALTAWFLGLHTLPPHTNVTGEIELAYQRHLPLKRKSWLCGYEDAAHGLAPRSTQNLLMLLSEGEHNSAIAA
jgi:hypothetical protein